MNSESTLILTRRDIAALMGFSDYVSAVEAAFRRYAEGQALVAELLHIDEPDGAFHIKAAGLSLPRSYVAVKINGNFAQNRRRFGLPTIQGAIILCDGENGAPLAFMDSIEITINRTGAATALAARYLARPDSTVATICGCGAQGRIQLVALKHVLPLERVHAFDTNEAAAREFARQMSAALDIPVHPAAALREAARQSDVIVTCTTSRQPFLGSDDVSPGVFVAAVGADSPDKQELIPQLLVGNTIVVDILEQCAAIGEVHHGIQHGLISRADVYAELGEIISGRKDGRRSPDEITILDTTGTALQDVAAAAAIYERARYTGIGYVCDLAR
jgi:ornithine cyclodeaminase/alanine dehydrogenase